MKNLLRKIISKFSKYSKIYENSFDLLNIINYHDIDVVLDVGASWGGYAKTLRRFGYKKRIISFEPVSKTHSKLLKNSLNDSEWQVHKKIIISDKKIKKLFINVSKDNDNSSVLELSKLHKENHPNSQYTHKEEVEIDSLDNLINHYSLSNKNLMLKIDVQGSEMDVLKSAINNLSKFKLIQIELSLQTLYEGQTLYREVLNFMNEHNYGIWNIFPGYKKKLVGQLFQFDGVFYNKNNYKY
jgi:FkbM family methyltransferase